MPLASGRWAGPPFTTPARSSSLRRSSSPARRMLRESTSEPALRLSAVQKSFGGTRALRHASLTLHPSEITALIGENGAGKSTLVKILSGVHQPDAGELEIDGRPTRITGPEHARRLGISVVHQECLIFDNLSVAENLFVSARPTRRGI